MTQPKRTRRRKPKPALSAEEYAFCERAINEHFKGITERYENWQMDEFAYEFAYQKLSEWREVLFRRGGVTE
jgi:hypothetical protein